VSVRVTVRAYNVRFGDCILLSVDEGSGERHALIDFGNAPSGVKRQGGRNDVFDPIAANIKARTKGVLDLVVMTHEHLDHMEGFYDQRRVFDAMTVRQVWMSLMSQPGYYKAFTRAQTQKAAVAALGQFVDRWQSGNRFRLVPDALQTVVANNNMLDLSNVERVDYLRRLGKATKYLSRGRATAAKQHGLGTGVKVEVLAPESDASVYYGKLPAHAFGLGERLSHAALTMRAPARRHPALKRPPHMAADEFDRLKDEIAEIDMSSVFAIDKAANNTSLVLRVTAGGKVLLFAGDAEEESWAQMVKHKKVGPVDFLKIAHHGSINGMPFSGTGSVLDALIKTGKKTTALVSTCRGVYGESKDTEIPSHDLLDALKKRCRKIVITEDAAAPGDFVDITV
jgi:beta-lactamase superfamily II metal-dependent hydrolase